MFDKPLFTFEMANNHQGDVEHGLRIIREIREVTKPYDDIFDFAFKFQYRDLDTFIHPDYQNRMDIKNVKRFQDTRISMVDFLKLKNEVSKLGMLTMCTPFDEISADRIANQGYDILKIASCSFGDWPLMEAIANTNLPVIASAAGSSEETVDRVVAFFRNRNTELSLMHCVAEYPTPNENLEMNQIDYYKNRYPKLVIGFSTHEDPENMDPVKLAVAKGARIFEKHVGLPTDEITLNGYSANPSQVAKWLEAAKTAFEMCGTTTGRYQPLQKELDDLASLQRGVFAKKPIKAGETINTDDIFLAFPCQPGQLVANKLSKYNQITVATKDIGVNEAVMMDNVQIADQYGEYHDYMYKCIDILKESNVVVPVNSTCEMSHHYGLKEFEKTGVTIIDCVNREYCKKLLIVFPGQSHPIHHHKKKEETFTVLYGSLDVVCNGEMTHVERGESMVVERGVNHSFSSTEGCVFEEISTTHYMDDSFYEDEEEFVSPRKTTIYLTKEMLE